MSSLYPYICSCDYGPVSVVDLLNTYKGFPKRFLDLTSLFDAKILKTYTPLFSAEGEQFCGPNAENDFFGVSLPLPIFNSKKIM